MVDQNLHKEAAKKIAAAKKILLTTHSQPDGDAIASVCAIVDFLEELSKNYLAFCLDAPLSQFYFLPHAEKISAQKEKINFHDFDLIIALDCGSLSRTNLAAEIKSRSAGQSVVEFDHHPKVDNYADIELKDPGAAATTEIIYHFFTINNIEINKKRANCILTGILTDTANFLYPSTSDKTIEIASEMLSLGARFPRIMENTWKNKSLGAMKLWGKALNRLKINEEYNIAFSYLKKKDIEEYKATEEELEGIAGFMSNLFGVKAIMILREMGDGKIKGSLRTALPDEDVSKLAAILGGGGHAKASGFKLNGRIESADGKVKIF